eukprot:gnl/Spiro4/1106_TR581_c0_g1_i1.p1 gnl/Spiro4/1106_TR581_c0_g1~~gnl/Spiro4/1106_TR581_c0_g1_i1.p1  ORF type:complete len:305 (-),score=21.67 gnl/Spiro4/1106_TR581_c0_g1_i1:52-966(-)
MCVEDEDPSEEIRKENVRRLKQWTSDKFDADHCNSYCLHHHHVLRLCFYKSHDVLSRWKRFLIALVVLACGSLASFLLADVQIAGTSLSSINWLGVILVLSVSAIIFLVEKILQILFEWTETRGVCCEVCCVPCKIVLYVCVLLVTAIVTFVLAAYVTQSAIAAVILWAISYVFSLFFVSPILLWLQWCCCNSVPERPMLSGVPGEPEKDPEKGVVTKEPTKPVASAAARGLWVPVSPSADLELAARILKASQGTAPLPPQVAQSLSRSGSLKSLPGGDAVLSRAGSFKRLPPAQPAEANSDRL